MNLFRSLYILKYDMHMKRVYYYNIKVYSS